MSSWKRTKAKIHTPVFVQPSQPNEVFLYRLYQRRQIGIFGFYLKHCFWCRTKSSKKQRNLRTCLTGNLALKLKLISFKILGAVNWKKVACFCLEPWPTGSLFSVLSLDHLRLPISTCPLCKRCWENALKEIGGGPRWVSYILFIQDTLVSWTQTEGKTHWASCDTGLIWTKHIKLISLWMTHCRSVTPPHLSRANKPAKRD